MDVVCHITHVHMSIGICHVKDVLLYKTLGTEHCLLNRLEAEIVQVSGMYFYNKMLDIFKSSSSTFDGIDAICKERGTVVGNEHYSTGVLVIPINRPMGA